MCIEAEGNLSTTHQGGVATRLEAQLGSTDSTIRRGALRRRSSKRDCEGHKASRWRRGAAAAGSLRAAITFTPRVDTSTTRAFRGLERTSRVGSNTSRDCCFCLCIRLPSDISERYSCGLRRSRCQHYQHEQTQRDLLEHHYLLLLSKMGLEIFQIPTILTFISLNKVQSRSKT